MSKKLLLSLASVGIFSAVAFVAYHGNIGDLRSSVVRPAVEIPAYSCAYYIPSLQVYSDLAGNSFAGAYDESTGTYGSDPVVTNEGLMTDNRGLIPFCTPEMIVQFGSIGEDGIFIPYGSGDWDDTGTGVTTPGTQNPTTPPIKQLSQLEILTNAMNDAKTSLASLEAEIKILTDSKKTLTDRKAVLEKSTGIDSIKAIQTRLAAIEKELTAQLTALTKNTKLKSVDEYEPALAQALVDFDAINAEMIPLQNQLTTLTNIELKQLNTDLTKLKTDLTALGKIKPQTTQTKTDIANKNKEITTKNNEITNKNKEITVKKAEIAKIQTRKTAAQIKYNTLKDYEVKYIQPFRIKANSLNKEKGELTSKLTLLTAELIDIKTKLWERLPALPDLIAKQKITVNETQTAYTDYVQALPTGANGTGTGTGVGNTGCNTTTGEGCDGTDGTKQTKECGDGSVIPSDQDCSDSTGGDSDMEEMKDGCWKKSSSGWRINGFGGINTNTLCNANGVWCVMGEMVEWSFKDEQFRDYGSWVVIKSWKCVYKQKPECPVINESCNLKITENEWDGGN